MELFIVVVALFGDFYESTDIVAIGNAQVQEILATLGMDPINTANPQGFPLFGVPGTKHQAYIRPVTNPIDRALHIRRMMDDFAGN